MINNKIYAGVGIFVFLIVMAIVLVLIMKKKEGFSSTLTQLPNTYAGNGGNSVTHPSANSTYTNMLVADASGNLSVGANVPAGVIVMWTGSAAPSGWSLCDGTNGTPDLRSRFVVGANLNNTSNNNGLYSNTANTNLSLANSYSLFDYGGEEAHTLSVSEMPSHSHAVPVNNNGSNTTPTLAGVGKLTIGMHQPVASSNCQVVGSFSSGGDNAHNNIPPYYALAFIMKMS